MRRATLMLAMVVTAALAFGAPAPAADDVLGLVPPDAIAFVTIQRPAELNAKTQALAKQMELPIPSPLDLAKAILKIGDGLDLQRTAAVAVLPGGKGSAPVGVALLPVADFAKFVGMDAREVQKLAERGKLPARRISGAWRFNQARVTEWLQQEMVALNLDEGRLRAVEQAMSEAGSRDARDHLLTALIGIDGIELNLPAKTKASALLELVVLADRTGLLWDRSGLLTALQARESLCSTTLPRGLAIPHPRQPMPYVSAEPFICVARVGRGLGFGSPYGDLTDLFFLICCHDDRQHLQVLARLVRMLDDACIDRLRTLETPEEALAALIEREEVVAKQHPL